MQKKPFSEGGDKSRCFRERGAISLVFPRDPDMHGRPCVSLQLFYMYGHQIKWLQSMSLKAPNKVGSKKTWRGSSIKKEEREREGITKRNGTQASSNLATRREREESGITCNREINRSMLIKVQCKKLRTEVKDIQ